MKRLLKVNRGFLIFLLYFAFFRSAMADWNSIPSSSMQPTPHSVSGIPPF